MKSHGTEMITRVKVEFTEEEYKLLIDRVKPPQVLAEFIHDVVIRSLRRKARKPKSLNALREDELP